MTRVCDCVKSKDARKSISRLACATCTTRDSRGIVPQICLCVIPLNDSGPRSIAPVSFPLCASTWDSAGNGLTASTTMATAYFLSMERTNDHIASLTESPRGQSQRDWSSTISVSTGHASTPHISRRSHERKTTDALRHSSRTARTGTHTTKRTLGSLRQDRAHVARAIVRGPRREGQKSLG